MLGLAAFAGILLRRLCRWVALRLNSDRKVGGSNPLAPTSLSSRNRVAAVRSGSAPGGPSGVRVQWGSTWAAERAPVGGPQRLHAACPAAPSTRRSAGSAYSRGIVPLRKRGNSLNLWPSDRPEVFQVEGRLPDADTAGADATSRPPSQSTQLVPQARHPAAALERLLRVKGLCGRGRQKPLAFRRRG